MIAAQGVLFDGTSRWRGGLHHYLGVSSFAERVVVPRSGAIRIRPDAPLDVVAIVGCAVATGVGAVRNTAGVPEGATVAVIGCGGVGLRSSRARDWQARRGSSPATPTRPSSRWRSASARPRRSTTRPR